MSRRGVAIWAPSRNAVLSRSISTAPPFGPPLTGGRQTGGWGLVLCSCFGRACHGYHLAERGHL
eukprot:6602872-Pyramimonas_sp.AAC.1